MWKRWPLLLGLLFIASLARGQGGETGGGGGPGTGGGGNLSTIVDDAGCLGGDFVIRNLADNAFDCQTGGAGGAPTTSKYVLMQTDGALPNAIAPTADDQFPVSTSATAGGFANLVNCNDTTGKLDWNGSNFVCVTDAGGGAVNASAIVDDVSCGANQDFGRNGADNAWVCTDDDDIPEVTDFDAFATVSPLSYDTTNDRLTTSVTSSRIMGRVTGGAGVMEQLTGAQAMNLLPTFSTSSITTGVVPGSNGGGATVFLNGTGAWSVPPGTGAETNTLTTITTGIADDQVPTGTGTNVVAYKPVPSCSAAGEALQYNTSTNTWGCLTGLAAGGTVNNVGDCNGPNCFMDGFNEGTQLVYEGSSVNGFETFLTFSTDPTADSTVTIPNTTGTLVTTGDSGSVSLAMLANVTGPTVLGRASGTGAPQSLASGGGTTNFLRADGTWAAPSVGAASGLESGETSPTTNADDVRFEGTTNDYWYQDFDGDNGWDPGEQLANCFPSIGCLISDGVDVCVDTTTGATSAGPPDGIGCNGADINLTKNAPNNSAGNQTVQGNLIVNGTLAVGNVTNPHETLLLAASSGSTVPTTLQCIAPGVPRSVWGGCTASDGALWPLPQKSRLTRFCATLPVAATTGNCTVDLWDNTAGFSLANVAINSGAQGAQYCAAAGIDRNSGNQLMIRTRSGGCSPSAFNQVNFQVYGYGIN